MQLMTFKIAFKIARVLWQNSFYPKLYSKLFSVRQTSSLLPHVKDHQPPWKTTESPEAHIRRLDFYWETLSWSLSMSACTITIYAIIELSLVYL